MSIYTDGACIGNPGPGGYGVVLLYQGHRKELSCGFRLTTNNRMEIMAAIEGLATLREPCAVTLHSDSRYLVDAMTQGWVWRWRSGGWRQKSRPTLNRDLWKRLLELCEKHKVEFVWVKGHSSNRENERCDQLANQASSGKNLPADRGYEQEQAGETSLFGAPDGV